MKPDLVKTHRIRPELVKMHRIRLRAVPHKLIFVGEYGIFCCWTGCDNSYNFSKIIKRFTQIEREKIGTTTLFKKINYFTLFFKLHIYCIYICAKKNFPGAGQDWTGSTLSPQHYLR